MYEKTLYKHFDEILFYEFSFKNSQIWPALCVHQHPKKKQMEIINTIEWKKCIHKQWISIKKKKRNIYTVCQIEIDVNRVCVRYIDLFDTMVQLKSYK